MNITNGNPYNIINIGGWGDCKQSIERSSIRQHYCNVYPNKGGPACVWTVKDINKLPTGAELVKHKYFGISLDIEAVAPEVQTTKSGEFASALLEKLKDYKQNKVYSILTLPGFGVATYTNKLGSHSVRNGRDSDSDEMNGMKWFTKEVADTTDYLCLMFYNLNNDSYMDELPPTDSPLAKGLKDDGKSLNNFADTLRYIWSGKDSIYNVSADQIILGLSIPSKLMNGKSRCYGSLDNTSRFKMGCKNDTTCGKQSIYDQSSGKTITIKNNCIEFTKDQTSIEKFINSESLKYASAGVSVWARVGGGLSTYNTWVQSTETCMPVPTKKNECDQYNSDKDACNNNGCYYNKTYRGCQCSPWKGVRHDSSSTREEVQLQAQEEVQLQAREEVQTQAREEVQTHGIITLTVSYVRVTLLMMELFVTKEIQKKRAKHTRSVNG